MVAGKGKERSDGAWRDMAGAGRGKGVGVFFWLGRRAGRILAGVVEVDVLEETLGRLGDIGRWTE